jgi:hypothetical protein
LSGGIISTQISSHEKSYAPPHAEKSVSRRQRAPEQSPSAIWRFGEESAGVVAYVSSNAVVNKFAVVSRRYSILPPTSV